MTYNQETGQFDDDATKGQGMPVAGQPISPETPPALPKIPGATDATPSAGVGATLPTTPAPATAGAGSTVSPAAPATPPPASTPTNYSTGPVSSGMAPDAQTAAGYTWQVDPVTGQGLGYMDAAGRSLYDASAADKQKITDAQSNMDAVNNADSAYNGGGTWDGTNAGRFTTDGINQGGDHFDPTQGKWVAGAPTTNTPGFGTQFDGKVLKPGEQVPLSAIDGAPKKNPDGSYATGPAAPLPPQVGKLASGGTPAASPYAPPSAGDPAVTGGPDANGILSVLGKTSQTQANDANPSGGVTTIDPTNDLRSAVITDTPDARTANLSAMTDTAAGNLANVDRTKLAQSMFDTFRESTDPQYAASIRKATQAAAAQGGLGSGELTTDYGNLANQRDLQLQTQEQSLINDALNGSIGDQFNKTSALSGLQQVASNQNNTATNDLRGERAYQTGQDQQSIANEMAQYQLEQQAQGQRFNQGISLLNAGDAGNPASTLGSIAASMGGLDPQTISQLAQMMAKNSGGGTATGATPSGVPNLSGLPGLINTPKSVDGTPTQYDSNGEPITAPASPLAGLTPDELLGLYQSYGSQTEQPVGV